MKYSLLIPAAMICASFMIHERTDAQWVRQQVSSDATFLYSIGFATDSIGCAVGSKAGIWSGRIVRTTDGGTTWTSAQVPDSSRSIIGLQWISPAVGYAAGAYNVTGLVDSFPSSMRKQRSMTAPLAFGFREHLHLLGMDSGAIHRGYILRSTDMGMSWSPYGTLPQSVSYILDISFPTPTTGFAAADTAVTFGEETILKTTDGGATWQKMAIPDSVVALNSINFVDSVHGCAAGYSFKGGMVHGIIVRTTDGGQSWAGIEFPSVDAFWRVSFSSEAEGYVSGISASPHGGVVFKTSDGGASWIPLPFPGDSDVTCRDEFLRGGNRGIVFGDIGLGVKPFVARTSDGGASWSQETFQDLPGFTDLIGATFTDSLNAFICGGSWSDTAVIYRAIDGGITEVKGGEQGPSFELKQNYPNPFNPLTTIEFSLPKSGHVALRVYNVLGEQVAELMSGWLVRGSHAAVWDASGNASGIYFYRVQSGAYSETKKLILLK
ncbi:MAG TPA: T9SS type A sorting domain-containing protein [Bacteroidota bacterium]|nr:T9SS type A sorting domain-containing protein [Bacteroidota bacterium]